MAPHWVCTHNVTLAREAKGAITALLQLFSMDLSDMQGGMTLVVKTGHTSVLVRNAFKQPLAELELGAIQASVRKPTPAVLQFYCGIQVSAWSFNSRIAAWEPVLESWDLIVKVDANSGSTVGRPCALPAILIDSRLACPHAGFHFRCVTSTACLLS